MNRPANPLPDPQEVPNWEPARERLEQVELARGSVPLAEWRRAADRTGLNQDVIRALYRGDRRRGADGSLMTDLAVATICRLKDVKDAWREMRVARLITCEYHAFYRAWKQIEPAIRTGLMHGVREAKKKQAYARYPTVGRNVLWYGDNTEADNYVADHRLPFRPWHAFARDAHNGWMWMAVVDSAPYAETQVSLVGDAMLGRTLPDGRFRGGVPGAYRADLGRDFTAERLVSTLGGLGVTHLPCRAYSPFQKGKVEGGIGIYMRKLATSVPGYVHADFEGQRDSWHPADGRLLTFDEYVMKAFEVLEWFNTEWRSEEFGFTTADERWEADTTPIYRVSADTEAEFATLFLRSGETRIVSKNGIRFSNKTYLSNEILRYVDEEVQLGFSEHDPSFLHIFRDGVWACKLKPVSEYTTAEGGALRRRSYKQIATIKKYQTMAGEQRSAGAPEGRESRSKILERDAKPATTSKRMSAKQARARARAALGRGAGS